MASDHTSSRIELTAGQAAAVRRAREVLAAEHGSDAYSLARRVGVLEFWLGDILALVDELTGHREG